MPTDQEAAYAPQTADLESAADGLAIHSSDPELAAALHISAVPVARGAKPPDGTFIVGPRSPRVFRVTAGKRRLIPDLVTLSALTPDGMKAVRAVTDKVLRSIPHGTPIPSRTDNRVYRSESGADTFVMLSHKRHKIPDADTLEGQFGGEDAVKLIAADDMKAIPLGAPVPSVRDSQAVDAYLRSLPDFTTNPPVNDHTPLPPRTTTVNGVAYDLSREAANLVTSNDHPWVLAPVTDILYPGAVLQGTSLATGRLAPIAGGLKRSGGTLTITTDFVQGGAPRSASVAVDKVDLAAMQDARTQLLADLNPQDGAADVTFDKHEVRTTEHGLVRMGVSFSYGPASVDLKASLTHDVEQTSVMVFYRQVFYRAAFTPDDAPSTFFAEGVTVDQVEQVAPTSNPPVYLAEIDYGRMLLVTMTGTKSANEMIVTLEAAINAGIKGSFNLTTEQKETLQQSRVQVTVVGGAGEAANSVVLDPVNHLADWITGGGTLTKDNPGVPLRYQARHCGTRNVVAINQTSQYEEVVAAQGRDVPSTTYYVWDGPGGGPRSTGILVANGDQLHIRASGVNWSGVAFTGDYGPDGWTTWAQPSGSGYPLPRNHPFCLAGAWDGAMVGGNNDWFYIGSGGDWTIGHPRAAVRSLWLGTNDNNPLNGDPSKRFSVHVSVQRRRLANVGRATI
ncbi:thiol-activated cytolysin family protein [Nocardioides renjunii]|uniref:thiol-activated cytolysin family protein n=1 Tax=Nocardioides renjunii TaxID=3095075 RepID=UPI002AFE4398|nr:thiol-activated cytolysin family protein [Nocardioides sp. S-34]WQQ22995.1 thiol-activated cytolysin family protein [Nocardioides sp. S-34]